MVGTSTATRCRTRSSTLEPVATNAPARVWARFIMSSSMGGATRRSWSWAMWAGQPLEETAGHARCAASHGDSVTVAIGETEPRDAFECPVEGSGPVRSVSEAHLGCEIGQIEVDAAGMCVECIGGAQVDPEGGRADDGQPEPFHVGGSGFVSALVDDRVVPAGDAQCGGGKVGKGGHRSGSCDSGTSL